MTLLLPLLLLSLQADAARTELELLRPDGRSFAVKVIDDLTDDTQVVVPDGGSAWQAQLRHSEYDGRLQVCADILRWETDGEQRQVTTACVVLQGRETPEASTFRSADEVQVRLTVAR